MGVHFVLNVVLDESNQLLQSYSGDPLLVEKAGSEFCRTVYEIPVKQEYDVVIASCGGYPKDINVYQAQKGLAHVTPLVKTGGDVILLAECPDGHGSETFHQTMKKYSAPAEIVEGFPKEKFRMGAHKAYLWARSLTKAKVYMVSGIPAGLAEVLMIQPVKSVGEALQKIRGKYASPPNVAVSPKANSTYVRVR